MKFKKPHADRDIQEIQREIQDKLADKKDIETKEDKVVEVTRNAPSLTSLKNGDKRVYYDGTNYYRYYKIGTRLFKTQLTEV